MCIKCVRDPLPNRQKTCLEDGAYLLNWGGCGSCGSKDAPHAKERKVEECEEEADFEEETTFIHFCPACDHVICEHYHKFSASAMKQEYLMECVLCGKGADEVDLFGQPEHPASLDLDAPESKLEPEAEDKHISAGQILLSAMAEQLSSMSVSETGNAPSHTNTTTEDDGDASEWD